MKGLLGSLFLLGISSVSLATELTIPVGQGFYHPMSCNLEPKYCEKHDPKELPPPPPIIIEPQAQSCNLEPKYCEKDGEPKT